MAMFGLGTAARLAREVRRDIAAVHERDPAARGVTGVEILATWPGVHALLDAFLQVDLHDHTFLRVATSRRADCADCANLEQPGRGVGTPG